MTLSRRAALRLLMAAAGTVPVLSRTTTAAAADTYPSNTALYADPLLVEGVDYGRRFRRLGAFDNDPAQQPGFPAVTVIAPHGGGIEPGTSELCLAVAGYHPETLAVTADGGPTYDYWMFEGLRSSGNTELHVTSTRCDDPVVRALCAGACRAISLHGCSPAQAGQPDGTAVAVVGGLDQALRNRLLAKYAAAGIPAIDATQAPHSDNPVENLDGDEPDNIVNRTLLGAGVQLELTTALRAAMFGVNTRAQRMHTTTAAFWSFVAATRAALAAAEPTRQAG
jgi:phage replication-related protein YjqB (UPF0714/DUF867 family)